MSVYLGTMVHVYQLVLYMYVYSEYCSNTG